ncbi:hypothetical protein KP509_35G029100 [Ceratopteris richardii]|uniref:Uncharacterized protein n=1 Tax=Ceratopteris richardii TaxID=49495 RepID=A0A8T2QEU9_CERRI|nr:hypothetical protein KP509_35G029100 [Ceratopteris richardii]KAH7282399.1 hypothetical protein KP509_35G029100 [Ceratopteris richardii]KAH7282400.1 hypothetical protein KP509_35G029100 [Ceratopteris richardii]
MNSELSVQCKQAEGCKNWISTDESNCMEQQDLCVFQKKETSRHAVGIFSDEEQLQHGISYTLQSIRSDSCSPPDAVNNVTKREVQSFSYPDIVKSPLKGGFSRESSRSSFWSPYSSTLSVVSEDQPWDSSSSMYDSRLHDDRSSLSSLSTSEESSSCSLDEATEVQSSYKGPLSTMCSLEEALPRKRGLSGFFAGKSKSFSCLADVSSVEDLAKPERPFSKKRKFVSVCIGNKDKTCLHQTQQTLPKAMGFPNKSFHGNKYGLSVLGVMSFNGDEQQHDDVDCSRRFLKTPRSYSLSDLQGAGRHLSPA